MKRPRPYTPKGWPTMTLARWWATVGRPLRAVAPKPDMKVRMDVEATIKGGKLVHIARLPRQARQEPQE